MTRIKGPITSEQAGEQFAELFAPLFPRNPRSHQDLCAWRPCERTARAHPPYPPMREAVRERTARAGIGCARAEFVRYPVIGRAAGGRGCQVSQLISRHDLHRQTSSLNALEGSLLHLPEGAGTGVPGAPQNATASPVTLNTAILTTYSAALRVLPRGAISGLPTEQPRFWAQFVFGVFFAVQPTCPEAWNSPRRRQGACLNRRRRLPGLLWATRRPMVEARLCSRYPCHVSRAGNQTSWASGVATR